MLTLTVCPLPKCPLARTKRIDPLAGAVGWLSHPLCGRQRFDPPCPAPKKAQTLTDNWVYGCIEELPVISYAGAAILLAPPARRLRFLDPPVKSDDLWILCNWARHFSQRNVSWAVTRMGQRFSLYRVL